MASKKYASLDTIDYLASKLKTLFAAKQDALTAGDNVTIEGSTISATDTVYTLPTATASTLGGVMVGSGLTVSSNGVLTADVQSTGIQGTYEDGVLTLEV